MPHTVFVMGGRGRIAAPFRRGHPFGGASDVFATFMQGTPTPTDTWSKDSVPLFLNHDNVLLLADFPSDDLPSGDDSGKISPSEMCMVYALAQSDNENLGDFVFSWHYAGEPQFAGMTAQVNPSWTWAYAYAFVGHFDWEINKQGTVYCDVSNGQGTQTATWGISGVVTAPPPLPPPPPPPSGVTGHGLSAAPLTIQQAIIQVWPQQLWDDVAELGFCESSWDWTNAYWATGDDGNQYRIVGWLQVNVTAHTDTTEADMLDPLKCSQYGYGLYQNANDFHDWSCAGILWGGPNPPAGPVQPPGTGIPGLDDILQKIRDSITNGINGLAASITTALQGSLTGIGDTLSQLVSGISGGISGAITTAFATLQTTLSSLVDSLNTAFQSVQDFAFNLTSAITSDFTAVTGMIQHLADGLHDAIVPVFDSVSQGITDVTNGLRDGVVNAMQSVIDKIVSIHDDIGATIQAQVQSAKDSLQFMTQTFLPSILQAVSDLPGQLWASLFSVDISPDILKGLIGDIQEAMSITGDTFTPRQGAS